LALERKDLISDSSFRSGILFAHDLFGKPVSTHRVEARGQAFPDHALRPLPILEEFLRRNGNCDLARLRLDEMRKRIHTGVNDRGDDGDHAEKT
jgi:hypothetical protein